MTIKDYPDNCYQEIEKTASLSKKTKTEKLTIGMVFESSWLPSKDGYYVKIFELFSELQKRYHLLVPPCPFSQASIAYRSKKDFFSFSQSVAALIIAVGGWYTIKFTFAKLVNKKLPVVWLLEAPVEENLLLPWTKHHIFFKKLLLKIAAPLVDSCICVSQAIADYAQQELGIRHVIVIPNAANQRLFKSSKKGKNVLDRIGSYKVMWAGAGQYPWQALDLFTQVANKLQSQKDILFILISSQTWLPMPTNLNNLLVLPSVPYEELPYYLNSADLLLCLYRYNYQQIFYNSPMKLFEFMSMNKPLIASDIGQISEIVNHKRNGLLTNNEIDDICEKILMLKKDQYLATHLALRARKDIINQHTWSQRVDKIQEVLQTLLNT